MPFNSLAFFCLFLPLVVSIHFLLRRRLEKWSKVWLAAASLFFYASGSLKDLPLLGFSLAINSLIARVLLEDGRFGRRRRVFVAGIALNVLFLFAFKYAAFFASAINSIFHVAAPVPHPAFPLGISFFTIQQIMFLVDCEERLVDKYDPLDHLVFGSLFVYVTMGPIVRWKQVVPQLNEPGRWRFNPDNLAHGILLFVGGLFKKVVLADSFFRWADAGFSAPAPLSLAGAWIAALSFAFQLYFDFSGYTDMAIGSALMLNIELPPNFNAPFRARSIAEFWQRWHMTLTNFVTSYLYTPMIRAMKRLTFPKALLATFLSMTIAGLWHGANWTFVVFGALHGLALVVNQCWKKTRRSIPEGVAWLGTFIFVVVAFVVFRSTSVGQAIGILASMFSLRGGAWNYEPWTGIGRSDQVLGIMCMLVGVTLLFPIPSIEVPRKLQPSWAALALAVVLASVSLLFANGIVSPSFVYRDF